MAVFNPVMAATIANWTTKAGGGGSFSSLDRTIVLALKHACSSLMSTSLERLAGSTMNATMELLSVSSIFLSVIGLWVLMRWSKF